jgi:hypothetical protein
MNNAQLIQHYRLHGYREQRMINRQNFHEKYPEFDVGAYRKNNRDLQHFQTEYELIKHFWMYGRFERRVYSFSSFVKDDSIKIVFVCDGWVKTHSDSSSNFATGGNVALYNIAYQINKKKFKNIKAFMCPYYRETTDNPFGIEVVEQNDINDNTLLVYPDGSAYNDFNGKHIMRYILLEIGTTYRDDNFFKTWNQTDFVYHHEPSGKPNTRNLLTIFFNPLFENKKQERTYGQTCYLIKKKNFFDTEYTLNHPKNSIKIDGLSLTDIVSMFNSCDTFYCYDLKCFLGIGSILCGCKTVFMPDTMRRTREEFLRLSIFHENPAIFETMFCWENNEDIHYKEPTEEDIQNMKEYLLNKMDREVSSFLNDVYEYFRGNLSHYIPTVKDVYGV